MALVIFDKLKILITLIYTVDPRMHLAQSGPATRMPILYNFAHLESCRYVLNPLDQNFLQK